MDKTYKLLEQLDMVAYDLMEHAACIADEYDQATYEYNRLSVEDDFLMGTNDDGEDLAQDMDDAIEAASEYLGNVHQQLSDFDKQLMKLIALRGKLAEEIGVPIGGKQWVRLETLVM